MPHIGSIHGTRKTVTSRASKATTEVFSKQCLAMCTVAGGRMSGPEKVIWPRLSVRP